MTNWTIVLLLSTTGAFVAMIIAIMGYRAQRAKGGTQANLVGPIFWGILFVISLFLLLGSQSNT